MSEQTEPKIEEHTIGDVYIESGRITNLLEKAKIIPDSHWNKSGVAEAFDSLRAVADFLEENIGSED